MTKEPTTAAAMPEAWRKVTPGEEHLGGKLRVRRKGNTAALQFLTNIINVRDQRVSSA